MLYKTLIPSKAQETLWKGGGEKERKLERRAMSGPHVAKQMHSILCFLHSGR